ncbi:MAG TPA: hypothetical protein VH107_01975 [Lacipirellulaceae bacterium]|jgi:hypothetical protein|nr:hypothetical protein [Lacipirellulaceae bacterium]
MNPFDPQSDSDRHFIWDRLVAVDCEAFANGDWSQIEPDFDLASFEGIRCFHSPNPDEWKIIFPDLDSYRDSWLAASEAYRAMRPVGHSHFEALLARCHLNEIDVVGDRAMALKKFYGEVPLADGTTLANRRQTLYRLHKQNGIWKIVGFFGQLPLHVDGVSAR